METPAQDLHRELEALAGAIKVKANNRLFILKMQACMLVNKGIQAFSVITGGKSSPQQTAQFMVNAASTGNYMFNRGGSPGPWNDFTSPQHNKGANGDAPNPYKQEGSFRRGCVDTLGYLPSLAPVKFDPNQLYQ